MSDTIEAGTSDLPESHRIRAMVFASPLTLRGGVARYWMRLVPALAEFGIELEFFTGHEEMDGRKWPILKFRPLSMWRYRTRIVPEIRRHNPDWVITSIPQSDMLYGFFGRSPKRPWLVIVHGQPFPVRGQSNFFKSWLWRQLWRKSVTRADQIVAVSDYAASFLPPGLDYSVVFPPSPVKNGAARKGRNSTSVGFLGRLSIEKDPRLFARIAKAMPEREFVAYGEGALLEELRSTAANVAWEGPTDDPNKVLSQMGTLLLTSVSEGLPLVLLEASLLGVPFVAADVGGVRNAVHPENRPIVLIPSNEREDVEAWKARLDALSDTGLAGRVTQLQEDWVQQFSPDVIASRLNEILRSQID